MGAVQAKRAMVEKRGISPLAVLGIVVLTLVLAAAGWLGWMLIGTNMTARTASAEALAQIQQEWANTPPQSFEDDEAPAVDRPDNGEPAWVLRIPSLDGEWPVFAGVGLDELNRGVGWYPGSAVPGELGNMAVTAHCVFNGEPFRRLLDLKVGDQVIVDTDDATFTYEMIASPASLTVDANESWVLDPVPGHTDEVPTKAIITLITCEDIFPTADRAVGFGTLTNTETK